MQEKLTIETIRPFIREMVDFIKPTYGPAGNKIIIADSTGHKVLDDGATIANFYNSENPVADEIIKIVREVSHKTDLRVGDGTTGSLIILASLIDQINEQNGGTLLDGLKEAEDYLRQNARLVTTKEGLTQIALMAYKNPEIAGVIADLIFRLGSGVIVIEKTSALQTTSEIIEGMQIDQGFLSTAMVNSADKPETILHNPNILVTDRKILTIHEIIPLIELIKANNNGELFIVAEDYEPDVLTVLNMNNIVAIKAPLFGDRKREALKDIALFTGGEFISMEQGLLLKNVSLAQLGTASKIIVTKDATTILGGAGEQAKIKDRVAQLQEEIKTAQFYDKHYLEERISNLTTGIGFIRVGGLTESEMQADRFKIEDAVNSTRLAYKTGVVKGGGQTLKSITTSSEILNNALKEPEKVLIENGTQFTDVDDPVDVLIAALQSAVSIALLLLSSKGIIINK